MPRTLSPAAQMRNARDTAHRAAVRACHRQQLEQAAHGMVSGTLREWPELRLALQANGIILPPWADSHTVQAACRSLIEVDG